MRFLPCALPAFLLAALCGCAPDYSPNTYASNAVQQANKVESGVVVGFRQVKISASGTVGIVSGGAAGGILGAQADVSGISSALGAVGGTLVGGIVGTTIEHVAGDTTGWEYIVRKSNGDLLSVTQREENPIPVGQKVLVITGNQARIVPDYSLAADPPPATTGKEKTGENKDENKEKADVKPAPAAASPPVAAASTPAPAPAAAAPAAALASPASASATSAPVSSAAPTSSTVAAAPDKPATSAAPTSSPVASAPDNSATPRQASAPPATALPTPASPAASDSGTLPQQLAKDPPQ
jgi:outer membrane lipoprotein SlyB